MEEKEPAPCWPFLSFHVETTHTFMKSTHTLHMCVHTHRREEIQPHPQHWSRASPLSENTGMSGEILKWKSQLDVLANTNVEKDSDQSEVRRNPER